jgi:hypothetical protein
MASGSTTFTKIVNKWNTALIGLMTKKGIEKSKKENLFAESLILVHAFTLLRGEYMRIYISVFLFNTRFETNKRWFTRP